VSPVPPSAVPASVAGPSAIRPTSPSSSDAPSSLLSWSRLELARSPSISASTSSGNREPHAAAAMARTMSTAMARIRRSREARSTRT
jgi:hypothetical protein